MAIEQPVDSNSAPITQFSYTIYDKNGNLLETGITPNPYLDYSWDGITLSNGQTAYFKKANGYAFTIYAGTKITGQVMTKQLCSTITYLMKGSYDGTNGSFYDSHRGNNSYGIYFTETLGDRDSGYYWLQVTNISSDPITITSVSLDF